MINCKCKALYISFFTVAIFTNVSNSCLANQQKTIISKQPIDLARKNACLGCHSINKKVVGPAFRDIAKYYKYSNDPIIINLLAQKVKNGGKGAWGVVPMPANNINANELNIIIKWILAGSK